MTSKIGSTPVMPWFMHKRYKPQGKPVCRQRQALNPIIGIDPRVEVLNLDPAEKGGISSTCNFKCVFLTSQN
jgi:hypothetical protein